MICSVSNSLTLASMNSKYVLTLNGFNQKAHAFYDERACNEP